MKTIYLLNSVELPIPGTHYFTCNKFIKGFIEHGYQALEINKISDLCDNSIVLLSNHGYNINHKSFYNSLEKLANEYPNCIYICWYYHIFINNIPFKKFILTGEHFYEKPRLLEHIKYWDIQNNLNNYVPFTFSSFLNKIEVGKLKRNEIYNGVFIGSTYKKDWVNNMNNIIYLGSDKWTPENPIPEEKRIQYFLNSKIAFGFHSDGNILNNVVTERVFEGMSLGCVVISDNPIAGKITNNIVQVATNKRDFLTIYNKLLNNKEECEGLQRLGYEWIINNGLYSHTAKNFIKKIKELKF